MCVYICIPYYTFCLFIFWWALIGSSTLWLLWIMCSEHGYRYFFRNSFKLFWVYVQSRITGACGNSVLGISILFVMIAAQFSFPPVIGMGSSFSIASTKLVIFSLWHPNWCELLSY